MNIAAPTPPSRVTGFASAVLLVLLLGTSGWPGASPEASVEQQVACAAVAPSVRAFCLVEPEDDASAPAIGDESGLPRVAPRCARVDSWGLPPARAPTSARS